MRKIPSRMLTIEAIKRVVSRRFKVDTQEELCTLVLRELKKRDENFRLSPQRAKRLALTIPEIQIKAKTRRAPRIRRIKRCPVCGSQIAPLRGVNLLNRRILIGYKCVTCAFQCDLEAFMPMKYIFLWRG